MNKTDQQFRLAVHAHIEKDNKILVVRRSLNDDFMPGFWDTPGGSLDFGEDPIKALIRETKEESNLDIKVGGLVFCHNKINPETKHHWFALIYKCEIIKYNKIILDPNEHDEYRWVTLQELEKLQKIDFLTDFYKNYLSIQK